MSNNNKRRGVENALKNRMGFSAHYIDRAFNIFETRYGTNYNLDTMTNIIVNLQNTDKQQTQNMNRLLDRAKQYANMNNFQSANQYYYDTLQKYPNSFRVHADYAEYLNKKLYDYRNAAKQYQLALRTTTNKSKRQKVLYPLAMLYYQRLKQYRNALSTFLKLSPTVINSKNVEYMIAYCYRNQKDFNNALLWCKKYEKKFPTSCSLLLTMATMYDLNKKDINSAERYYNLAIQYISSHSNASEVYINYGCFLQDTKKQYENARKQFVAALECAKTAKGRENATENLAVLCADYIKDYETSLNYYFELNNNVRCKDKFNYSIAKVYKRMKDMHSALTYFKIHLKHTQQRKINNPEAALEIAVLYEEGENYFDGNDVKANEYYNIALNMDKHNVNYRVQYRYGNFLMNSKAKKYRKAIPYLQKAADVTDKDSKKALCYKQIAHCYQKLNNLNKAVDYFYRYQEKHKDKIDAVIRIAKMYEENDEFKDAEKHYNIALKMNNAENNWSLLTDYGCFLHIKKKEFQEALIYFEKSLDVADTMHRKACSLGNIGATCGKLNEINKAEEYFKRAMIDEANDASIAYKYGRFIFQIAKNIVKAEQIFQTALENVNPDTGRLKSNIIDRLTNCWDKMSDFLDVEVFCTLYLQKNPMDPDAILLKARLCGLQGNIEEAHTQFNIALNLEKGQKSVLLHHQYSLFLINTAKDYRKAILYCDKALKLTTIKKQKGLIYACKADCHYHLNNIEQAIIESNRALDVSPSASNTLHNLGYYYLIEKKYELATQNLLKALEIEPDRDLTSGYVAFCLYEMKRFEESIQYFKKSLSNEADVNHCDVGPLCMEYYANILYAKGEYRQSIELCEQLMKMNEFNGEKYAQKKDEIYYLTARNYSKLKDFENALKFLQKPTEFDPNRPIYENQIAMIQNSKANFGRDSTHIIHENTDKKQDNSNDVLNGSSQQFYEFLKQNRLEKYFDQFQTNGCSDIRDIEYILGDNEFLENDIGMKKIETKRFWGRYRKLKINMDEFKDKMPSVLYNKLNKYGIVTMDILCNEIDKIENKLDLKNKFNLNQKQCDLLWRLVDLYSGGVEMNDDDAKQVVQDYNDNNEASEGIKERDYSSLSPSEWSKNNILQWVNNINLSNQWKEVAINAIQNGEYNGNDIINLKSAKDVAKLFQIQNPMLCSRLWTAIKKLK